MIVVYSAVALLLVLFAALSLLSVVAKAEKV